jgi:hypothetical protein
MKSKTISEAISNSRNNTKVPLLGVRVWVRMSMIEMGAGVPVDVSEGNGVDVGNCEYRCRCGMSVGGRGYGVGKIKEWARVSTIMTIYRLCLHPQSYLHPHTVIHSSIRIHTLSPPHTRPHPPRHPPTPTPTSNSYSQRKPNAYSEQWDTRIFSALRTLINMIK